MKLLQINQPKLKQAIWGQRNNIANLLGVHPVSVSRKIHGKQSLTLDELNLLAQYLNQSTMNFIYEVEI